MVNCKWSMVNYSSINLRSNRRANAIEQQALDELAAPVAGRKCFEAIFSAIIYSLEFLLLLFHDKRRSPPGLEGQKASVEIIMYNNSNF